MNNYTDNNSFDKGSFVSIGVSTAARLIRLDLRHIGLPGTAFASLFLGCLLLLLQVSQEQRLEQLRWTLAVQWLAAWNIHS